MGCICSKGVKKNEIVAEAISFKRESQRSLPQVATPGKKDEGLVARPQVARINSAGLLRSLSRAPNNKVLVSDDGEKKSAASKTNGQQRSAIVDVRAPKARNTNKKDEGLGIVDVPNGSSGEHGAAGWPAWLTSVAEEATKGWLPRRADSFEKLEKIGQGTYSSVYKARDLQTDRIVALKKVRFVNMDPESVRFMAREIQILRRLDHPNVIKLEGIVTSGISSNLYLVFEYMEHDLAGLATRPGTKFTEPQIKCFMQQLLSGLEHCHSRGVLHRDIKGSNLLIDNNGVLRIGDFGLATIFDPDKKKQLTSRVVTLWYRPPELLLGATEYGVAVDLWSAGCILAELLAGKPIMPGRTEVEQLHKIFKLCGSPAEEYWRRSKLSHATIFRPQQQYPRRVHETFKGFPPSALDLLDKLLAIEPADRGTAASALKSEYFTTKPLACDPSSLPKFPPSKEYDARLRDEEAKRQKESARKGQGAEPVRRGTRDSHGKPVQDYNLEVQKGHGTSAGFSVDRPGKNGYTHGGSIVHPGAYGNLRRNNMGESENLSGAARSVSTLKTSGSQFKTQRSYLKRYGDNGELPGFSERRKSNLGYNTLDVSESSQEQHVLDRPASSHKKNDTGGKDSRKGYGNKNKRIHYSGPLMPPGGNLEDMLKEHEKQIQQAVRKARVDKTKGKKNF